VVYFYLFGIQLILYQQPSETAAPVADAPAVAEEVKEEKVGYSSNSMNLCEYPPFYRRKKRKRRKKIRRA
jgi:hypothetical protein